MIFFSPCGFKPRENSCYGVRKHTACSGQVGVCVPAQINICLKPLRAAIISQKSANRRSQICLLFMFILFFFLRLFPISYRGHERSLCLRLAAVSSLGSWPKMRKKRRARIDEIINRDNNRSTTTH